MAAKSKRSFLVTKFSVSSFIVFIGIIYILVWGIDPVFENFVIAERKNYNFGIVNKLANKNLTKDDFGAPFTEEKETRVQGFFDVAARGAIQTFLVDSSGKIIYAHPKTGIGSSLINDNSIGLALERGEPLALFEAVDKEYQSRLGIKEAFVEGIPIIFENDTSASGLLYTISRVGLIRYEIEASERSIAMRIIAILITLYLIILIIVWGASKTIRGQQRELESYARTLEDRVVERTQKLKESIEKQLKQAAELSRIKDEFIFVASHELRSPAMTIVGNAGILAEDPQIKKLPEKTKEPIDDLYRAGMRLQNLVSDLLGVARMEYGSIQINIKPVALASLITESVKEIRDFANRKNITLEVDEASLMDLPQIQADPDRLKEIFNNLLTNAIKYNKPDGQVLVSAEKSPQIVAIHFKDSGIGLSTEEQKKIFSKFWRANHNSEIEGTGLGLWITKQLAYKMKGEITVDSSAGEGSTFTVWFHAGKI